MCDKGGGSKTPQNVGDIIYGWSLWAILSSSLVFLSFMDERERVMVCLWMLKDSHLCLCVVGPQGYKYRVTHLDGQYGHNLPLT